MDADRVRVRNPSAKPFHRIEDPADGVLRGADLIGIFDAQDEDPPVMAGKKPVKKRRPGAPDMEIPRRRRRKTNADGWIRDDHGAIVSAQGSELRNQKRNEYFWRFLLSGMGGL